MSDALPAVQTRPYVPTLLPDPVNADRLWKFAATIAQTEFVPRSLRGNTPAVLAAILTGRELGLPPMRALRQIAVVDGKPTPAAELQMAMVLAAEVPEWAPRRNHEVRVVVSARDRCVVRGRRAEWPDDYGWDEVEWTVQDAVQAGLCTLDPQGKVRARSRNGQPLPWEAYTRAMLRSRAVSELCRGTFPDVTEGLSYVPEELGAPVDGRGVALDLSTAAGNEEPDPLEGVPEAVREQVRASLQDSAHEPEEDAIVVCGECGTALDGDVCPNCSKEPARVEPDPEPDPTPDTEVPERQVAQEPAPTPPAEPDPSPAPQQDPEPAPPPPADAYRDLYRAVTRARGQDIAARAHADATAGFPEAADFNASWAASAPELRRQALEVLGRYLDPQDAPSRPAPAADTETAADAPSLKVRALQQALEESNAETQGDRRGDVTLAMQEYRALTAAEVVQAMQDGFLHPEVVRTLETHRPGGDRQTVTRALPTQADPPTNAPLAPDVNADPREDLLRRLDHARRMAPTHGQAIASRIETRVGLAGNLEELPMDELRPLVQSVEETLSSSGRLPVEGDPRDPSSD